MKAKITIAIFLLGLLLLAIVEVILISVFADTLGLPSLVFGSVNAILGLSLVSLGSAFILWSVFTLFSKGIGTPAPIIATKKLVVSGPYAYTRNPMTLGSAVLFLGISIWYGSLAVFILVILIFAPLLSYIHKHETKELSDRFGVDYQDYKQKTPFLLPSLHQRG